MSIAERRKRQRAQRHRLIVTTARELAEAEGWDAVTVRRLADRIEYSQPVLYSHFAGKGAILAEVALEGFAELAEALARSRAATTTPGAALTAVARTYLEFAETNPAVYDAMFILTSDVPFAEAATPPPLQAAFGHLRDVLVPLAGLRDADVLAEVCWSALHGLATLTRSGRIPADRQQQRLTILTDLLLNSSSR